MSHLGRDPLVDATYKNISNLGLVVLDTIGPFLAP